LGHWEEEDRKAGQVVERWLQVGGAVVVMVADLFLMVPANQTYPVISTRGLTRSSIGSVATLLVSLAGTP
jgi:hypothetical protein